MRLVAAAGHDLRTPLARVTLAVGHGEVILTIIDKGPGIPAELLEHVFEPARWWRVLAVLVFTYLSFDAAEWGLQIASWQEHKLRRFGMDSVPLPLAGLDSLTSR